MSYQSPNLNLWMGRATPLEESPQYWYQVVQALDFAKHEVPQKNSNNRRQWAILSYACDEGVRRNQGRVGAAKGADAIKLALAKLAWHYKDEHTLWDAGSVLCDDQRMEFSQESFARKICDLLLAGIFPIGLGGGHDIAYANAKGILNSFQNEPSKKLGIINLDAHFDLRPIEHQAHSGTPFTQILDEHPNQVNYFALGIQKTANTPSLFKRANSLHNVDYLLLEDLNYGQFPLTDSVLKQIEVFIERHDAIYLTIDLDGFSAIYAPGVSAPSPLGWSVESVLQLISFIVQSKKLIAFDIAEMNPVFDRDNQTAKLAARLIDTLISCYSHA